jgi:hypothetical protein
MIGPYSTYAPPGVSTQTTVEPAVGQLLGALRVPVLIGVGKETLAQTNFEIIRGSSSLADTPIFGEDTAGRWVSGGTPQNPTLGAQDGSKTQFRVRNWPIVDGTGRGLTTYDITKVSASVNGQQVVVTAVDGTNGLVSLLIPPATDAHVTVNYYFHRKDTRTTDNLTAQVTRGVAVLVAPKAENYTVVAGTSDTFVLTVNDGTVAATVVLAAGAARPASDVAANINAAAIPGLTASVHIDANGQNHVQLSATGNIRIGSGNANGALGFSPGDYTNRAKSFRTFQGPIVDGSDGGITTTDPSKVTVLVDGQQVLATAVDGTNRLVTLGVAPRDGQTVTVAYWFNTFQDTFDYLPNSNIITVGDVGIGPGRRDYINGIDFVVVNDSDQSKIQWGSAFQVRPGVKTGLVPLDSTQIAGMLVDDRIFGVQCDRYTDPTTSTIITTKFVMPLKPTTGNGRDTPLGTSLYQTVTNGRIDLPTNRPDLVVVHVGKTWRDAAARPPVAVLEVDSANNTFTLRDPVPADYNAYATFWYNRLQDDVVTASVVTPGPSGTGTYTLESQLTGTLLYGVKFGVKSGLSKIIQWPSGAENFPDAILTGAGNPVAETVMVTFLQSLDPATHASFSTPGQEPYDIYNATRNFGGIRVDGTLITGSSVDLSTAYRAQLLGSPLTEPLAFLATDYLQLVIDGVTLAAVALSGVTTVAGLATAINAVVDADTQTHPDGSGTFAASAPNTLASTVIYGSQRVLKIRARGVPSSTNGLLSRVLVQIPVGSGQTDGSVTCGLAPNMSAIGSYSAINQPATTIGTMDAPFAITAGVNDRLELNVDGVDVTTVLPAGAAVPLNDVVTAINDAYVPSMSSTDAATYLANVITLLNAVKTGYNLHRVSTTFHVAADGTNIISGTASDLATSIALANEIKTKLNLHYLQTGVHQVNDTVNTVSATDAIDLQTTVHLANEVKRLYNLHRVQTSVHGHNDTTNIETLTIASDQSSAEALIADLYTQINAHYLTAGVHLINDTVNTLVVVPAPDSGGGPYTNSAASLNEMKAKLNLHFVQSGVHVVNDVTNTITTANASAASLPSVIALANAISYATTNGSYNAHRIQTQGAYHVHGTNDGTNSVTASMTEIIAHTGLGYYADQLVLMSRINTVGSQIVVKSTGTANDLLGLTSGGAYQRLQPTSAALAGALNADTDFAAVAVAWAISVQGLGGYLRIDSLSVGSGSTLAFTAVANTAFVTDTGLGIVPGTSGDVGEPARAGFQVASSQGLLGSHGTGFPGQTYTDATTGLRFTILPPDAGDYDDGGKFTLIVGQTFTADLATLAIPGLQLSVYNTVNTAYGTTALITTYPRSGAEPAIGDVYYVSYEYTKTDLSTQLFRDSRKIQQAFGNPTPDNPLSLGARLAQLNGAVIVGLKQVLRATGSSQASAASYALAIDEQRKPVSGSVKPDVIVPLTTDPQVFAYLNQHCIFMGTPRQEGERIGVVGVAAGTSPLGVQAVAQGLNSEVMIVTYPDSYVVSVADLQGNSVDQLVDGSYAAAALSGSLTNPAFDVAMPLTRRQIVGFKQLGRFLDPTEANQIAVNGVSIFEQYGAGIRIRHGLTTNVSSVIMRTPSVILTIQYVQQMTRRSLDPFIGQKLTGTLIKSIESAMRGVFSQLIDQTIVNQVSAIEVTVDDNDPTILRASAIYVPVFPLEYIVCVFNVRVRS